MTINIQIQHSENNFVMRDCLIGLVMTLGIEKISNIHKYIFDKQDDEIFSEYHDTVAGGCAFSPTTFGEIVLPP